MLRSECFKNFGEYVGDVLENQIRTSEKNAKACQARCQATEGCSFFSFKEVRAGCYLSGKEAQMSFAKGVVGGPADCEADKLSKIRDQNLINYKESETPCTTTGGTAGGDACSFPFKRASQNYVNCTTDNRDQVGPGLCIKIKEFFSTD